jgi:membrane-associated protease RseP (regulator of RpoE activity)
MFSIFYLFIKLVWNYVSNPALATALKMPPIMPLIPYLPQMFKLNFLPNFYFSYWILILAIIAISHEFFHGIFAAKDGIKTKTTGFGFFPFFFPVFLAAFVNLDEKTMEKKSNFSQRTVLSAGTFANILTTILTLFLMIGFFSLSFSSAGVVYDDYAYNLVPISNIISIGGETDLSNAISENFSQDILTKNGEKYYAIKDVYNETHLLLYYSSPAIKSNLSGAITEINGIEINSIDSLSEELSKYAPQEKIVLGIFDGKDIHDETIVLEENPENSSKAWIGITFLESTPTNFIGKIVSFFMSYKNKNIYYKANYEFAPFIYDFLWWLLLISFSVALINMLPMGIFDGGRFFYLTILKLTKSKKIAEKSFAIFTIFLLLMVGVLMFVWIKSLF